MRKCDRCHAIEKETHPLHGFEVRLESITYKGKQMQLCQRCKIQVEVKKRQLSEAGAEDKSQINNFLSKFFRIK